MKDYNPQKIEKHWQSYWEKKGLFKAPKDATPKNKMYILPQLPYPSGSGLHVGHAEVYTACDIYARYQRMQGKKVLQAIGWDSFGLPAENYAIKNNVHPRISTDKAIDNFRSQIKLLGISVDWDREVGAHNPDYYKWTQWFFLLMYKRGLAYRKKQSVNWCAGCKTVLANEQVTDGKCERCETVVEQRDMEQWFLKITEYADRLIVDLDKVDWPEETKQRQRQWIGRSEGAEIEFRIQNSEFRINVFTTRPDTLFGATYLVLSPEHKEVTNFKKQITNWDEVEKYINETKQKTELERQTNQEKTGVELKGVKAINPASGEEIPVWIADYVLATYGTGAIMAVPAHDERDWEFANKFGLNIKMVVCPNYPEQKCPVLMDAFVEEGHSIESEFLNGMSTKEAKEKMIEWLEKNKKGKRKVQYKLRDWSVSRQRFWGAPIPMLYDDKGELQPVPEKDLPVLLPDDVDFKPTGESPLNYSKDFQYGVEKKYGKGWKREVDTLDTFMCSSWYYYRYLDPKNDKEFASKDNIELWMGPRKKASLPGVAGSEAGVDFYLGGEEHVNGHLLYARFFTKVLFDAGFIDFDEPFKMNRHQGLILGEDNRKMSKRWNNSVNPTDIVNEFGADTLRLYEMFMGPLDQAKPWSTNGVKGMKRFLDRVWERFQSRYDFGKQEDDTDNYEKLDILINKTIKKVTEDIEELKFNTAISSLMIFINESKNLNCTDFTKDQEIFNKFLIILSPFAPHITEELWSGYLKHCNDKKYKKSITLEKWPKYDEDKIIDDVITIVVQVNGKVRASLEASADISEEDAKKQALEHENIKKWLDSKEPKKIIYVKGKLVSIVA